MAISTETQKIIAQLETIKQTNGQITIQDLRQAFSDMVPTISQDLANKNTLFYTGANAINFVITLNFYKI